jgi:hypothetical protein
MPVSRRKFILAGQTVLAAAALPLKFFGATGFSDENPSKTTDLLTCTEATFRPLVNSSFTVRTGALTPTFLTLLSVEEMDSTIAQNTLQNARLYLFNRPVLDTFALNFYVTGENVGERTYELEHPVLGRFSLFLVPSGVSTCTAIINHLQNAATMPIPSPKKRAGALTE